MQSAPVAESHAVSGSTALAALAAEPAQVVAAPVEPAGEVIPFPTAGSKVQAKPEPAAIGDVEVAADEPIAEATGAGIAGPASALDAEAVKQAMVTALAQQGHASASQLISTARFTLETTNLRVEVPGIGKKMLALTVNAAAEKIIKQELQRLGGPARFMVIPGEGVAATTPIAAPAAGSIQQAALEHPMVQRAKEIFNAEVRSVVDLRTK